VTAAAIASPLDQTLALEREPAPRWRQLAVLSIGLLCAMSPSFAASAVAPVLRADWGLDALGLPILTISVLLGFAVSAIALAAAGVPDVIPGPRLFTIGLLATGVANLGFAFVATDLATAIPFRVLTGAGEAAAYPIAFKMVSGWFRRDRGLALGVAAGALNLGIASPLLFRSVGLAADLDRHAVLAAASVACLLGAVIIAVLARSGPFDLPAPRFSLEIASRAFREPAVRLATLGYLGHMWELFGMWTWLPLFMAASFVAAGNQDAGVASFAAFVAIGSGVIGCVVAGAVADRIGRSVTTIAAMAISGTCAVLTGLVFGSPIPIVVVVAVVWGITIIADSAQFSAAVSELAPPGTAGSALSVQLASGFVLTSIPILLIGALDPTDAAGWFLAFGMLALGPVVGSLAMWRLRARPESVAMAGGHR
jgi:MFS family permease